MPGERVSRAVSCDGCYFRQELLCALKTDTPCPTFRATVGRGIAAPQQAQLIPVTRPAAQVAAQVASQVVESPRVAHAAPTAQPPFAASDDEANFTVSEARMADPEAAQVPRMPVPIVQAQAVQQSLDPALVPHKLATMARVEQAMRSAAASRGGVVTEPVRSVAASRGGGVSVVVDVERQDEQLFVAPTPIEVPVQGPAQPRDSRVSRVARRVAERYPQAALKLC